MSRCFAFGPPYGRLDAEAFRDNADKPPTRATESTISSLFSLNEQMALCEASREVVTGVTGHEARGKDRPGKPVRDFTGNGGPKFAPWQACPSKPFAARGPPRRLPWSGRIRARGLAGGRQAEGESSQETREIWGLFRKHEGPHSAGPVPHLRGEPRRVCDEV